VRQSIRIIAASLLLAATAACSNETTADLAGPSFAKGGGMGGTVTPPPVAVPSLAGHWTQSNVINIATSLGTTDYWYVMDIRQSGATLSGTAAQHLNTFNFDGSPWLVDFVGSPGKISGTVKADGSASIVFSKISEHNITIAFTATLSADGTTLVVNTANATGAQSFTR
jgi:hypothetical protein